jgi:D-tyrosyl-tRNA(Tyr) deacylase
MIAVTQRVSAASVTVDGQVVGRIGPGLLALVGVAQGDGPEDAAYIAHKLANLRIFEQDGRMTRSVRDIGGCVLVVSQFTLLGDARRGNRPDFMRAAPPGDAEALFDSCVALLRALGLPVETGIFRKHMDVHSINDGPVTILLDSKRGF